MITGPVAGKRLPVILHRLLYPAIATTVCFTMVVMGVASFDELNAGGGVGDVIMSALVLLGLAWLPIHLFGTTYSVSPTHLIQHRWFRRSRAIEWRALTHVATRTHKKPRAHYLVLRTAASRFAWAIDLGGRQDTTELLVLLAEEVRRRPDVPGGAETGAALAWRIPGPKAYA